MVVQLPHWLMCFCPAWAQTTGANTSLMPQGTANAGSSEETLRPCLGDYDQATWEQAQHRWTVTQMERTAGSRAGKYWPWNKITDFFFGLEKSHFPFQSIFSISDKTILEHDTNKRCCYQREISLCRWTRKQTHAGHPWYIQADDLKKKKGGVREKTVRSDQLYKIRFIYFWFCELSSSPQTNVHFKSTGVNSCGCGFNFKYTPSRAEWSLNPILTMYQLHRLFYY